MSTNATIRTPSTPRLVQRIASTAIGADVIAGLTLAAVTVPEQMATARLGHFPPEIGFLAFIAGTLGFALFGASRYLTLGADSTITPIFAGSLALLSMAGSPTIAALAAMLAVMVGVIVALAGLCRLGWIASLLSVPVTTGFLAGIAVHILASQLPVLCGVPQGEGGLRASLASLAGSLGRANPYAAAVGLGVLAVTAGMEKWNRKWPGALLAVGAAAIAVFVFSLQRRGVMVLGAVAPPIPQIRLATVTPEAVLRLAPLSFLLAMVVMVQSAATTRAFPPASGGRPNVNRDFIGVGMASLFSGLAGAFPVNASPPRTAVSSEAGARSKWTGVVAAAAVGLLAAFGSGVLRYVPNTALAGVLLFVALRIIRLRLAMSVLRESKGEFALILTTALAIILLPIAWGVAVGILLSLLHGMWMTTRARAIALARIPGSSVWWPPTAGSSAEVTNGVLVVGFQAPLTFLNAEAFLREFLDLLAHTPLPVHVVVLEASSIVEIDYTAAHVLADLIRSFREKGMLFAIARLESLRAQDSFKRFGILDLVGSGNVFRSVYEAFEALATPHERKS